MDPVENKLSKYKKNWIDYVRRMTSIRHPKEIPDNQRVGRRITG